MGVEHDNSGYSISASGSSISTSGSESGGRMYCWSTNLSQVSGSGRSQLMMGQVPWPLGAGNIGQLQSMAFGSCLEIQKGSQSMGAGAMSAGHLIPLSLTISY